MTLEQLNVCTKKELAEQAKVLGIVGFPSMTKEALVQAIGRAMKKKDKEREKNLPAPGKPQAATKPAASTKAAPVPAPKATASSKSAKPAPLPVASSGSVKPRTQKRPLATQRRKALPPRNRSAAASSKWAFRPAICPPKSPRISPTVTAKTASS